ncbi:hypothetical protein IQ06DRAFT_150440 [Phaeosphaeriaceae sp. SRC1lsM3a]|nr:hypothetical protein IQ06DRAFT_150440 [Stagonospora sp. SRC1lsM3a]
MTYQHYDGRQDETSYQYDNYVQTRNPAQHSVRFNARYEDYAQRNSIPQQSPYQDYATYGYNSQTRYSNMGQDRYDTYARGRHQFQHDGHESNYSTSDYISPPNDHEKRRDCSEQNRTSRHHRYSEPGSSARAWYLDKSNYELLKESGSDNKYDFIRLHGIKPRELDAYDQANDILDSFRHVDAHNQRPQNSRSHTRNAQMSQPRSSRHKYTSPGRHASPFRDSDIETETCIDSDVPVQEYLSDSASDIASFKSSTSRARYWSRSPSMSTRTSPGAEHVSWRSVSRSPARRRKGNERDFSSSDDGRDRPRGHYVSSSPQTRRYSSTSIRRRSRSRSIDIGSSGSSALSYRSGRWGSVFGGSEIDGRYGGGRSGLGLDSESGLSEEGGSSESGSDIESTDGYDDDDYLDDGGDQDEQIGVDTEYEDY